MLRTRIQKPILSRGKSPFYGHRLGIEGLEDRRVLSADFGSAFAISGATGFDTGVDAAGNVYVAGSFKGVVDFDPGAGSYNLTSRQDATSAYITDLFVAKYDANNGLLWANRMGGRPVNFPTGGPNLAVGADGSVWVTGSFTGAADFGSTVLTSVGAYDPFATRLDANGNFLWATQLGAPGDSDFGDEIAVDGAGNAYVSGEYQSSATDTFVTKLDPAGAKLWTNVFGGSTAARGGGFARGDVITADVAGNVYVTGRQGGAVDFDPGPGKVTAPGNAFVLKLTTNGGLVWAKAFAQQGGVGSVQPEGIAVDSGGNVYSTGFFWANIDFDPGKAKYTLSSSAGGDIYVSKLDTAGNFVWAKRTGGPGGGDQVHAIGLDDAGSVYVTGTYNGTSDFDPGPGTYNLTSVDQEGLYVGDAYVWKLDAGGNFGWAASMGGVGGDDARGIAVDGSGNVYTTGGFTGPADFDPSPTGTYTLTGPGLFVSKLVQSAPLAMALIAEPQTATTTESEVSSPPIVSTGSSDPASQPTAPGQLLMPTKASAKNKLADAALAQADENWLDSVPEDDLLLDLVAAM
jgi:hypothetical protein